MPAARAPGPGDTPAVPGIGSATQARPHPEIGHSHTSPLRGRVLPGVESPVGYARDATEGLLINPPIQGHDFDPEPDEAEGN